MLQRWGGKKYQGNFLKIIDTEESPPPSVGTITSMDTTVPLKKQKNSSQKDGGISPLGGISAVIITDTVELVKHKNQSESPLV